MSSYKWWLGFVLVFVLAAGALKVVLAYGQREGRAEQEAFDHANASKIENRCREVPEPCVIMRQDTYDRLMMNAITSSLGIPKPHKAAPKPGGVDLYPCIGTATEANCYNSANVPTREKQPAPPLTGHAYLWHDTDGKYKILHSDGDVQVCPFTELSDCINWVATADWTTIH